MMKVRSVIRVTKEDIIAGIVYGFLCIIVLFTAISHFDVLNLKALVVGMVLYLDGILDGNLFNILSIILSGIISLVISSFYYKRGNREALKKTVIYPIKELLGQAYNTTNYDKLLELSKNYNIKYMTSKEYEKLELLVKSYGDIKYYNKNNVNVSILMKYFDYSLKKHGIETEIVPLRDEDGEIVDWVTPIEDGFYDLRSPLMQIFKIYDMEFELNECKQAIIKEFNDCCKSLYTREKLEYFVDYELDEVLEKSKIKEKWNRKFKKLAQCKKDFLNQKIAKD